MQAAAAQASALGMESVKRCFVRHPIQDRTDEELRTLAEEVLDDVLKALTAQ